MFFFWLYVNRHVSLNPRFKCSRKVFFVNRMRATNEFVTDKFIEIIVVFYEMTDGYIELLCDSILNRIFSSVIIALIIPFKTVRITLNVWSIAVPLRYVLKL